MSDATPWWRSITSEQVVAVVLSVGGALSAISRAAEGVTKWLRNRGSVMRSFMVEQQATLKANNLMLAELTTNRELGWDIGRAWCDLAHVLLHRLENAEGVARSVCERAGYPDPGFPPLQQLPDFEAIPRISAGEWKRS